LAELGDGEHVALAGLEQAALPTGWGRYRPRAKPRLIGGEPELVRIPGAGSAEVTRRDRREGAAALDHDVLPRASERDTEVNRRTQDAPMSEMQRPGAPAAPRGRREDDQRVGAYCGQ
jgi:hypothetical protein